MRGASLAFFQGTLVADVVNRRIFAAQNKFADQLLSQKDKRRLFPARNHRFCCYDNCLSRIIIIANDLVKLMLPA